MRNATFRSTSGGRRIAAAVLAATAVLTVTAPSAFADSTPAPATTAKPPTGDGAKGICKRESKAEKHVERALNRLDGGATTVGSVARMQQRADNAKKEGHAAIGTLLDHKLAYRKGLVTTLQQRQKDLKDVAAWCSSNNGGK